VIEADWPNPTLPEVFKEAKDESPDTFKEDNRLVPLVTVNEVPTPMLPVVVKDDPEITPRSDVPKTLIPDKKVAEEVTFKDEPMPTEPDKVEISVTVKDLPIPTLPVVTKDPPIPMLPNVPVPETFRDEPMPTKPEKNPVPLVKKL